MQVAGTTCAKCGRNIALVTDGTGCTICLKTFHSACLDDPATCPLCARRLDSVAAETRSVSSDQQVIREWCTFETWTDFVHDRRRIIAKGLFGRIIAGIILIAMSLSLCVWICHLSLTSTRSVGDEIREIGWVPGKPDGYVEKSGEIVLAHRNTHTISEGIVFMILVILFAFGGPVLGIWLTWHHVRQAYDLSTKPGLTKRMLLRPDDPVSEEDFKAAWARRIKP